MKLAVTINGEKLKFNVSLADYERVLNEMTPSNKISPMKNFIRQTVDSKDKTTLDSMIASGLGVQIAGAVLEAYTPEVNISVEKLDDEPTK